MDKDKKSEIHITNNFNAPIGQHIDHVDTINFRMDGNGEFHFGIVENMEREERELSDEMLANAIENCQRYFWGNSAYAVVYCIYRDDYDKGISQTGFERLVEQLPYTKNRDYKCSTGTIANAFSDNAIYKLHVNKWETNGASKRVITLLNRLREELEL